MKIVGILNITPDSFSDGGKYINKDAAIAKLHVMIQNGASIIDIGAESTRPGSTKISHKDEWSRLENILPDLIYEIHKYNKDNSKNVKSSIDSYHFETIKKAHEYGIDIINDINGLKDKNIIEYIAQNSLEVILMHNHPLEIKSDLIINQYADTNIQIINFARSKINFLIKSGICKSKIIFDPGIGFNKNALQSIRILKYIKDYKILGVPIYIGHSKKSFLDSISVGGDRAQKTFIISKFLYKLNIDYIRVHDVVEHNFLLNY